MRLTLALIALATAAGAAVAFDDLQGRDTIYAYDLTPRGVLEDLARRQSADVTEGSTGQGGTAVISHDEPGGQEDCNMVNLLSQNQQASWTEMHVSTCCVGTLQSTCYLRSQSDVEGQDKCVIPNCDTLQSNDATKMVGFKPLQSTWGKGEHFNQYYFAKSNGARPSTAAAASLTLGAAVAVVVAAAGAALA